VSEPEQPYRPSAAAGVHPPSPHFLLCTLDRKFPAVAGISDGDFHRMPASGRIHRASLEAQDIGILVWSLM
jgi:hypothetical protein